MDVKVLSSIIVLVLSIGGLTIAAEDRYVTEVEVLEQTVGIKAMLRQQQLNDLQDEIDYLSDRKLDGVLSRSEEKKLGRTQRRLDVLIKGR